MKKARRRSSRWEPGRCARRGTPARWSGPRGRRESRSRSPPASARRSSATSARPEAPRTGSSATSAAGAWRFPGGRGSAFETRCVEPGYVDAYVAWFAGASGFAEARAGYDAFLARRIHDPPGGTEQLLCLASNTAASHVLGRPKAEVANRPLTRAALDLAMRRTGAACPRGVARAPRHDSRGWRRSCRGWWCSIT